MEAVVRAPPSAERIIENRSAGTQTCWAGRECARTGAPAQANDRMIIHQDDDINHCAPTAH